jgi:predicted N-acetyltransferase YhbS
MAIETVRRRRASRCPDVGDRALPSVDPRGSPLWSVAMEVREVAAFSPDDEAELTGGEADPYGTEHLEIAWQPKDRHVILADHGRLIAHAGFVPIEIETAGSRLDGLGLGGVMVARTHRGQGIDGHLVQETTDRMRATGRSFAMLFCRQARLAFYRRLGWEPVPGTVTVDQDEGPIVMPLLTCWLSLDGQQPPPAGDVRLLGAPF